MTTTLKYLTIALIAIILISAAFIVHRLFFQFNLNEIKTYAMDEASKYKDKDAAFKVIMDGVDHILSSHNLSQQVLRVAKANGTDKEQELVAASIAQCKLYDYLPK